MPDKPTYEELEQRVKELELKAIRSKELDQELRKSNELFEKTFISQRAAIFILGPEVPPKIIHCNPAAVETFGYTRQEILGRTIAFLHINEATLKKFQKNLYPTVEDCGYYCLPEFEMKRKDGTVFLTEHNVFPLQNDRGLCIGWVSVVRDITERKQMEEALRESEGKLKAMLQSIGDHISMIDKDLNIIWANETAKSVFGKNIIGKKCYETYHKRKESCEPYPCITLKAFQDGKIHEHETKVIDKSGRKIFFHRTANIALTDKEGKPKTVIEISRDITEQRRAEKLLHKSYDNLERLIAQRTRDLELKTNSLEEANTALKVLLKQREKDRIELEEKVLSNIKELVDPYLEKLERSGSDSQKVYLGVIKSNIDEIISPFTRKLSNKYLNLTPSEIRIANLVKQGKTSKEMAAILNISTKTVGFHRENIRKKLGLKNKKANLRSHILSLQ